MQSPPFERYLLTLRLTAPARFHFLHGGVLRGLLSAALEQHELPVGVVPFAPESGLLFRGSAEAAPHRQRTAADQDELQGPVKVAGSERLVPS